MSRLSQSGFTLVELMLAMALFSVIMIVSTTGFIAINRTYTRGAIKKQLNGSIRNLESDVSATLRNPQSNPTYCKHDTAAPPDCADSPFNMNCISGARYFWKSVDGISGNSGLYRDSGSCSGASFVTPNIDSAVRLVDERFVVEKFTITPLQNYLFQVTGVLRTVDGSAQTLTDNLGSIKPSEQTPPVTQIDPFKIKCKGSSAGSIVQSCAVQSFDFIINSRAISS